MDFFSWEVKESGSVIGVLRITLNGRVCGQIPTPVRKELKGSSGHNQPQPGAPVRLIIIEVLFSLRSNLVRKKCQGHFSLPKAHLIHSAPAELLVESFLDAVEVAGV